MSIRLDRVTRRFGPLAAVDDLTADIAAGCFFVVLGPSGCGKSTLLRLIAGLEPPDAGEIALHGRPVAAAGLALPPEARGVGVVFQSYALWPHMTVLGNVAFPIEANGQRKAAARAQARTHLAAVELSDLADRRPADLSGGQRQRVALARCLASQARVVLMDEPLANLDPHLRAAMEGELADFHRRSGATTLYITHDQREAMALADRVAVMRNGRFEQVAPPDELHDRPATEFVARFIGQGAVVDAQVLGAGSGRATVTLAPGLKVEVAAPKGTLPGPGRLVLRPADLRLDAAGIRAQVLSGSFRGDHWETRLAVDGLSEPLIVKTPQRVDRGAGIGLRILNGWLLGRDAP